MRKQELVIQREIKAPKKLVFEAFTQAEHLQHWWGPVGMKLEIISLDVRPNGKFHYKMEAPNGHAMFGILKYLEIQAPDKIVFINAFADEKGNVIKAPFDMDFPLEIKNTWTFEEKDGITTLSLRGNPLEATPAQLEVYAAMTQSMNEGFGKTFDQLDVYIKAKFQVHQELKTSTKGRVSTYLNFPGNTEEVFNFYKSVFGGEFGGGGLKRFADITPAEGNPVVPEDVKNLILHAELAILGGHILMGTDAPESMGFKLNSGNNMHINLEPETRKETKRLFDALSAGGTITMELMDMFFGAYYGSCTDKYGINWMFHCRGAL